MSSDYPLASCGSGVTRSCVAVHRCLKLMLAFAIMTMLGPRVLTGQEVIDQWMTLKGIDTLSVRVESIMPEGRSLGVRADSLEDQIVSMFSQNDRPAVGKGKALLTIDVLGFAFGGRVSFSVKVVLWQPVVLVASGEKTLAETWSERRDAEAEESKLVEECSRSLRSVLERFLEDYQRANATP